MTTKLTRDQILALSKAEKISLIYKIRIQYERGEEILIELDRCLNSCIAGNPQPTGLMLVGPTGAGKSTLLDQFVAQHPRQPGEKCDIVPVLRVPIEKPANVGNFMTSMLKAYGDPLAATGSLARKSSRITTYVRESKTRMLMLDDIHDMLEPGQIKVTAMTSDWIKTFIKESKISCVLSGIKGRSEVLLESNEQLGRLFPDPEEVYAFQFDTDNPETIKTFRKFIYSVEVLLPFPEKSGLSELRTAHKIHIATGGLIGYIMELIRYAAIEAVNRGVDRVDEELLHLAFRKRLASERRGIKNPFTND
ncbi:MAG: TniB family NTP-binding protein [Anaerolineales bacterium]|nr:TniB family NTP-binding protein [Anaerolineales bacterium]